MVRLIRLKVKEIAQAKGISMRRLERLTGIDGNSVRRMYREPEKANITLETLGRVAKALGVDASELVESAPDLDEGDER